MKNLLAAAEQAQIYDFLRLAEASLGRRAALCLQLLVLCLLLGSAVCSQIWFSQFAVFALRLCGVPGLYAPADSLGLSVRGWQVARVVAGGFPLLNVGLSLQKDLAGLRYAGLAALAAVLYCGGLVAGYFLEDLPAVWQNARQLNFWTFDKNAFVSFSLAVFSYCNVHFVLAVRNELADKSKENLKQIIDKQSTFEVVFYSAVALLGYAAFGRQTPQVILFAFRPGPLQTLAVVALLVTQFCAVPLLLALAVQMLACRQEARRRTATIVLQLATAAPTLCLPDLLAVQALLGCVGACINFLFPALIHAKLKRQSFAFKFAVAAACLLSAAGSLLSLRVPPEENAQKIRN